MIPVELGLWSYARPRAQIAEWSAESSLSSVRQAALRLDRIVGIAETALPVALELPASPFDWRPESYDWFQRWASQLISVRESAVAALEAANNSTATQVPGTLEEPLSTAPKRLDAWLAHWRQRLANENQPEPERPLLPITEGHGPGQPPGGTWMPLPSEFAVARHFVTAGNADRLRLPLDEISSRSTTATRATACLSILGLAAASLWLARRPVAWRLVGRWPQLWGAAAGLVVWAWLWPSWLGWPIIAGSLIWALLAGWPRGKDFSNDSTVVRIKRPR
jgi:hypothetical protein